MKKILITGAAGRIGKAVRYGLRAYDFQLTSCDIIPLQDAQANERLLSFDIQDLEQVKKAMQGIDCVIHLAAIPTEDSWEHILPANIVGTYNIFEAARQAKVKRVIFASTNRVISFYRKEKIIGTEVPLRPDGLYGVSKIFGETLGRLYADKYGLSVACLRIGSFEEKPREPRHVYTWISPRDMVQLVYRCIVTPDYHYIVVYGLSANEGNLWQDNAAEIIGYHPVDKGEDFADAVKDQPDDPIARQFHGGKFCAHDFTGDSSKID